MHGSGEKRKAADDIQAILEAEEEIKSIFHKVHSYSEPKKEDLYGWHKGLVPPRSDKGMIKARTSDIIINQTIDD